MGPTLRPAEPQDLVPLRELERLAGERFRDVGLAHVADHEPPSVDELARYAEDGRAWVADGGSGPPLGYVLVDVVDGCAHVEQVAVHPAHQGRGIGRALMDVARDWARATGRPAVTLTTFDAVEWNRPLYEHLGYRVLRDHELGPELRARRRPRGRPGSRPGQQGLHAPRPAPLSSGVAGVAQPARRPTRPRIRRST
jgi:GNAT superfamily N-acetyltransferase